MKFELDKQTQTDLEIFRDEKYHDSIFKYFNRTETLGGKEYLYQMMHNPFTDIGMLTNRSKIISELSKSEFSLPIDYQQMDFITHYLKMNIAPLKGNFLDASVQIISYKINPSNDYYIISTGIVNLLHLFKHLKNKLKKSALPLGLTAENEIIREVIEHDDLRIYIDEKYKLNFTGISKLDKLFRKKHYDLITNFVKAISKLDAYISVAKTAYENKLAFPKYVESKFPKLEIEKLYHPILSNAVPYDISIEENKNLCFLTGPNMAGKSTFLKTIGLSIYLSHIGFPVPAKAMKTSIYNGIITTINLSDNLNKGYSHFYSEVRRVKETAVKLKDNGKLFIIFDELFRGTNVKDAFDASLLIIEAFSKIRQSTFFVSTHITEIAEDIKKHSNIDFKYFDSKLVDNKPVYNYKICNGVSHERLGMFIVKNEGIVEILDSISEK